MEPVHLRRARVRVRRRRRRLCGRPAVLLWREPCPRVFRGPAGVYGGGQVVPAGVRGADGPCPGPVAGQVYVPVAAVDEDAAADVRYPGSAAAGAAVAERDDW